MKMILALFLALPAFASTVSINNVVVCTSFGGLLVDPAGNVTATCGTTPINPGPPNPPPPPPPTVSNCVNGGTYNYKGESKTFSLGPGQCLSIKMPILSGADKTAELLTVATTSTPQTLTAQVSISKYPGDFSGPKECIQIGGIVNGNVDLYGMTSPYPGYCKIEWGFQYYANIRNVNEAGTPTCNQGSCQQSLEYFGDMK